MGILKGFKFPNYQITDHKISNSFDSHPTFCFPYCMELRKDPITRSWVITGDDVNEPAPRTQACRFCGPTAQPAQMIATVPGLDGGAWSARNVSDAEVERFLRLAAQRILDLKRDSRFKYVSIFKNQGEVAGQEFEHPTSQLTATTFVPRRVLYELRAGRDYFDAKERCVFCDILAQEERQGLRMLEIRGDYAAFCPYAPRVPYETWILPRSHESAFERTGSARVGSVTDLASLLQRTLQRIRTVTESFHLVLHTAPNNLHPSSSLGYWKTLDDDYHWHIEILPILEAKAKSYTFKEVYYSPVASETAVKRLRDAKI